MPRPVRLIVVALLSAWLTGCGILPRTPAGSAEFITADADTVTRLAGDAARQLAVELPPAQTVLAVTPFQEKSQFAASLMEQLRLQGFGVERCGRPCAPTSVGAIQLSYVAANIGAQGYRLALSWPGVVLTRAYVQTGEGLQYAGLWTRGELPQ